MNSLKQLILPQVKVPRASIWIKHAIFPIVSSIMMAIPLGLLLQLITRLTVVPPAPVPLSAGLLALIIAGFLWWARYVLYLGTVRTKMQPTEEQPSRGQLDVWSLVVALAGLALLNWVSFVQGSNLFLLLVEVVLVIWLWRRSLQLVRRSMEFAELSTTFKVCMGLLLLLFLLMLIVPPASGLLSSLAAQLPLFFLSGLISLSLARLEAIRQVRLGDGSQADPTRNWLLALTLLGSVLVVLVLVIETLVSFNTVELWLALLNPIWNILGIVAGWILYAFIFVVLSPLFYAFNFLINLIPHRASPAQPQPNQGATRHPPRLPQSPHAIPPEIVNMGRLVLFAVVIIGILLLVRATLRRLFLPQEQVEVDEERERLDARSLLREQWREFWNRGRTQSRISREPLEPGSARARYRELLDAVQTEASVHARQPNETPVEYEARLLPLLQEQAVGTQTSPEVRAMQELTRVYADERYGAKRTDELTRASLGTQVPRLIQRLTRKKRA